MMAAKRWPRSDAPAWNSTGVRCGDVATELNDIYRSHNLLGYRSFGYGHSFGVLSHYYGREAGVVALAKLDVLRNHRHRPIGGDLDEGPEGADLGLGAGR